MILNAAMLTPSFEEIYKLHHRYVYGVCLHILRNKEQAEDITQNVFISVLEKLESFEGKSALRTWIYRIAVNCCLMHMRKASVKYEEAIDVTVVYPDNHNQDPDNVILIKEICKILPPGYRNALILHDYFGCEHNEVSKILDCSEGTSKSQLHKARLRARNKLKS